MVGQPFRQAFAVPTASLSTVQQTLAPGAVLESAWVELDQNGGPVLAELIIADFNQTGYLLAVLDKGYIRKPVGDLTDALYWTGSWKNTNLQNIFIQAGAVQFTGATIGLVFGGMIA